MALTDGRCVEVGGRIEAVDLEEINQRLEHEQGLAVVRLALGVRADDVIGCEPNAHRRTFRSLGVLVSVMRGTAPHATAATPLAMECELRSLPGALAPRTTQISLSATGVLCRLSVDDRERPAKVVVRFGKLST